MMRTQFLYPLTFPVEENDRFVYLTALNSANKKQVHDLIGKFHIYIDMEIPLTQNATLTMSLQVLRLLDKNTGNPITKYKIMYREIESNLRIRADNGHPFPHIDVELPHKPSVKMVFDTDPSDYEASVNTVLRYAERHGNPMVGIDYWLNNITSFRKGLIDISFKSAQSILDISTAFTDVARLVSLDILTRKGEYIYGFSDFTKLVTSKFIYCLNYERTNHRPLKISKNLIQQGAKENLFPFLVIMKSEDGPLKPGVFDVRGNELPSENIKLLGKTSYEHSN